MRRLGRALDMLRIELSALSAQELKRLLDMARARNQTALIHQLNAELESRPTRVEDWSPLPMNYARPDYAAAEVDVAPPRRNGMMAATAALAAFVSAAVTWGLSVPPPQPSAIEAPRAAVVLASLAPVGPPAGFSEPPPEGTLAEPEPAPVQLARAEPVVRSRSTGNRCYALPTPADRLVCGYPSLADQDRQLRGAYDRALAAGADRRDLDRAQALWRAASENVSDRATLSERYARRIRELEAAASPPPPPPADEPPF